jgi:hypothetical protein
MSQVLVSQNEQPTWRKASYCASGQCVEVAQRKGVILLRDSKDPHSLVLSYTAEAWREFAYAVKSRRFDDLSL